MEDDQLVIGGELHIEFDSEIVFNSLSKCRKGILRYVFIVEQAAVSDEVFFVGLHLLSAGRIRIDRDQIEYDQ